MGKDLGFKLGHWLVALIMMAASLPCLFVILWLLLSEAALQGDSDSPRSLVHATQEPWYPAQQQNRLSFLDVAVLFTIVCLVITYVFSRKMAGCLERDLFGLGRVFNGQDSEDVRFRFAEFQRLAAEGYRVQSGMRLVDQARRESEDRLRLALTSGGFGTWDWDLESGRLIWDEHTHDLYGIAPGKFSGSYDDFLILLHPDDRDVLYQQLTRMGESRDTEAHEVEFRVRLSDGRERTLADRSEVFFDSNGRIERMMGVTWDITSRKRAEKALVEARDIAEDVNLRMKQDLQAAARVQQALLPEQAPDMESLNTAWCYRPCEELAGDALNLFSLGNRYLVLYVLDVCGHGVPSSLLAVSVSRNLSLSLSDGSIIAKPGPNPGEYQPIAPAEVADRLNRLYPMDSRSRLYFTLLYGILDIQLGEFRYVSAGNPGPIRLCGSGGAIIGDAPAVPIGLLPDSEYEESVLQLDSGDRLYLSTDGVIEERNAEREMFGGQRLCTALGKLRTGPLSESLDAIVEQVVAWRGMPALSDDIAMIGLEWRAQGR